MLNQQQITAADYRAACGTTGPALTTDNLTLAVRLTAGLGMPPGYPGNPVDTMDIYGTLCDLGVVCDYADMLKLMLS